MIRKGRVREIKRIRKANRAAAVGKLMLKEFTNWQQFLQADVWDLENLPRRNLKSGYKDIKNRLSLEIKRFCNTNFEGMDEDSLANLYEAIKKYRGFEIPLWEFEDKYAGIKDKVLNGISYHATVSISLWGLQFKYPEDELSKDIETALKQLKEMQLKLNVFLPMSHSRREKNKEEIASLLRIKMFTVRSVILSTFNLMESYLNGLAWDYVHNYDISKLSNKKQKVLTDTFSTSIYDKLIKYPEIIAGKKLWNDNNNLINDYINTLKPYRNSLTHPSPFSVPDKFGGYNKLKLFYRVNYDTVFLTIEMLITIISKIHNHINKKSISLPNWLITIKNTKANIQDTLTITGKK